MDSASSKAKAVTLQVWVRPEVNEQFNLLKHRLGIDKAEFVARMLEWFTAVDERLQFAIVTRDQEAIDRLLPSVVGQMMSVETGGSLKPLVDMDYDELAQVIQGATELLVQRGKAYRAAVAGKLKAKK